MDKNNSNTNKKQIRRYYLIMFCVKVSLGFGLFICGTQGVGYTKGQDLFGPPYYVGGFAAGICLLIASLFAFVNYKSFSGDVHTSVKKSLVKMVLGELACTLLAGFSCFFGIIFVTAFGWKRCDANRCNYTANIVQNKTLEVIILIGLLMTAVIVVISIYKICGTPLLGAYGDWTRSGLNAQSNITSDPGSSNPWAQSADSQIRNLEEQNRLLREQLELHTRLQQQQQQQQQQQPYPTQNFPAPPPPSYSECVSNTEKEALHVTLI